MSKLTKFFKNPQLYFYDALGKKIYPERHSLKDKGKVGKENKAGQKLKVSSNVSAISGGEIPPWFNSTPGSELLNKLEDETPLYLYIPWISEHSDALIKKIESRNFSYALAPFDFVQNILESRKDVSRFARENPHIYRRMVAKRLAPLRHKISGIVFTFDWSPVMKIIANVCEELDIPRILIPHESVFVNKEKYYYDITSYSSVPVADVILAWGGVHESIFNQRGYPADRIIKVGSPKLDAYTNYEPELERSQFYRLFGLSASKKTVLFAAQPLDSQLDQKVAREKQREAIWDLLATCQELNMQLIVRMPPSRDYVLNRELRDALEGSGFSAVDKSYCYLVSPEESLYHADFVTSINSTMLFEGMLMGKPSISLKYMTFDQLWEKAGVPAVKNRFELSAKFENILLSGWEVDDKGWEWASQAFSIGAFDGRASERISDFLEGYAVKENRGSLRKSPSERVFSKHDYQVDVVQIPSKDDVLNSSQKYISSLVSCNTVVNVTGDFNDLRKFASVDLFFQWGITESKNKSNSDSVRRTLGREKIILEDGFIRSLDIGLSGEPTLSVIMDNVTAYYDATQCSRLESRLEAGPELNENELLRAKLAIEKIVSGRVSKYNHAPDAPLNIGKRSRKKILLVDQRFGDQSVVSGLASERSFDSMLSYAIKERSDCDIIVKQHPDAIKGGKASYLNNEKLSFSRYTENLHVLNFDINPHSLFDIVDEVFVVTSGMGFEALLANKTVHCFGVPFYSGWGVTVDHQDTTRRSRKRSVEDIFYYSYIESSRYFHPEKKRSVEVEDVVDYIVNIKGGRNG